MEFFYVALNMVHLVNNHYNFDLKLVTTWQFVLLIVTKSTICLEQHGRILCEILIIVYWILHCTMANYEVVMVSAS